MRLHRKLLFVLLLLCLSGYEAAAQVNAPPDRDYFTAHEDPEAFRDLTLNDLYHTNRVLHSIQVARCFTWNQVSESCSSAVHSVMLEGQSKV